MIALNGDCEKNLILPCGMKWGFSASMSTFHTSHPFKDFDDQKKKLVEEKKLIIDNPDLLDLSLKSYNYYTIINGYKDLFLDPALSRGEKEVFKKGTTFSMLYQAHWMDITMSSILFKYTLLVEKKLKTRVSYLLAQSFGVNEDDYLRDNAYNSARQHKGKLNKVRSEINKNRDKDISAIHYMSTENNLPPWIAAKSISFGNTFIWYQVLRGPHKQKIAKEFLTPCPFMKIESLSDFFYRLMGQVYEYRNLSAHGNRTFMLQIPEKYRLVTTQLKEAKLHALFEKNDYKHRDNLFSVIVSILVLLDDPYAINNFIIELRNFFLVYEVERFNFNGKDVFDLFNLPRSFVDDIEEYIKIRF